MVFNGSFKTSNNKLLNDILIVRPTIQQDLLSILLRFRKHVYAFTADIIKMYRKVEIHEEDCDYERIWWRFKSSDLLQMLRLRTITYGTSCAPFLAIRTLRQLANDENGNFQKAARVLLQDFYVDDEGTGAEIIEEAT